MTTNSPWLRTGVAVVVGVKLLGLVPLLFAIGDRDRRGATTIPAAAVAAEHALSATPVVDRTAPVVGPSAGASLGEHPAPTRTSPAPAPTSAGGGAAHGGTAAAPLRIPGDGPSAAFASDSQGLRTLFEAVRRRDAELAEREAELARRETALKVAATDLDGKIRHLEALTGKVTGVAPEPAGAPPQAGAAAPAAPPANASMAELGKIYGAMKAEEAAPLFDRLDSEIVYQIFRQMKQRQISSVLPLMDPEKAVALTERLSGRRLTPKKAGAEVVAATGSAQTAVAAGAPMATPPRAAQSAAPTRTAPAPR
jgi:flagellar motility protein MotE (MotC chaperone)